MDLLNSLVDQNGQRCSLSQEHLRDMDSTAWVPPSGQSRNEPDENVPRSSFALQSIDDFEKENGPYEPNKPKSKLVRIQGKSDSESISRFYQLCQSRGIQPIFTIPEVSKGGFTARVVFGSDTEDVTESYPSKQSAKEAVCKLAIARLPPVDTKEIGQKRKASYTDVVTPTPQLDTSENWIGILLEFAQREKLPKPEFREFATTTYPIQYACTISMVLTSGTRVFGSEDLLLTSKQAARASAAKEAVLWLRENEKIPPAGIKRQRTDLPEGSTGLTQIMSRSFGVSSTESYAKRVHDAVISLGYSLQPEYHIEPSSTASGQAVSAGLWDVAASFDERDIAREPRLAGRIGQVKHIFGKQKAKEACCQQVLQILEDIEQSRKE